uniref:Uncharacterized protein n=1 Tax=Spongospora subterranea TaxID=70186 RepID=A0A0H5QYR8_9EUKA|eukprot:CRZ07133.1 hypothetical protein [Spongospora subterranea]
MSVPPWALKTGSRAIISARIASLSLPQGCPAVFNPFSKSTRKMKAAEWHMFSYSGVFQFLTRDLFQDTDPARRFQKALYGLLEDVGRIFTFPSTRAECDELHHSLVRSLAQFEQVAPTSFMKLAEHWLAHIMPSIVLDHVDLVGPAWNMPYDAERPFVCSQRLCN